MDDSVPYEFPHDFAHESPRLEVAGERACAVLQDGMLRIYDVPRGEPLPEKPLLTLRVHQDVTLGLVEECAPGSGRQIL